jgi:membrane-bound lytic murein transglycosylase B
MIINYFFFYKLACILVRRLKNANKVMNESNKMLKEIQEKHGVDENMILCFIKYQQESDFGIYFFFINLNWDKIWK